VHAAQSGTAMVRGKREAFGEDGLKSFENRAISTLWNYGIRLALEVVSKSSSLAMTGMGACSGLRQVLLKQTECKGASRSSLLVFRLEW
jgi:hypothetical protein